MKLHEAIAKARYSKKISLRRLQELTGISQVLLSRLENGLMRVPSFYKIVKISQSLGLSLDYLAKCEMETGQTEKRRKEQSQRAKRTWKNPRSRRKIETGIAAAMEKHLRNPAERADRMKRIVTMRMANKEARA
jgi:transcriptional regulator with XRE-family HTH domain